MNETAKNLLTSHSAWITAALGAAGSAVVYYLVEQNLLTENGYFTEVGAYTLLRALIAAVLGAVAWFLVLSWLDKRAGFSFKTGGIADALASNPVALGHYLGMRALAVALVVAAALLAG